MSRPPHPTDRILDVTWALDGKAVAEPVQQP